jgi:murein DD-endopeptidase MepM/ murein hydrolase activator NlpD
MALGLILALPLAGLALPDAATLSTQIEQTQSQLNATNSKKTELSGEVKSLGSRISGLQDEINGLSQQEASVQRRLDVRAAQLEKLRKELEQLKRRLAKLTVRYEKARTALADRLVERYKEDPPDAVTVVLESQGFNEFLERTAFMERLSDQDHDIVTRVSGLKDEVTADTERVGQIENRVHGIVQEITEQRDMLAAARSRKEEAQGQVADVRAGKKSALAETAKQSDHLQGQLDSLEADQAAVQGQLSGTAGTYDAGPIRQGSGQLIWPVNGPITSPFCETRAWEACHPGIDIGVSSGTPIRAAADGRVITAGPNGGYGNYTCIQHGGALSTCYAHQSSIGVSVGQEVHQGDVIGLTGCTGLCFGDHLHFETRINGSVTDPMAYL